MALAGKWVSEEISPLSITSQRKILPRKPLAFFARPHLEKVLVGADSVGSTRACLSLPCGAPLPSRFGTVCSEPVMGCAYGRPPCEQSGIPVLMLALRNSLAKTLSASCYGDKPPVSSIQRADQSVYVRPSLTSSDLDSLSFSSNTYSCCQTYYTHTFFYLLFAYSNYSHSLQRPHSFSKCLSRPSSPVPSWPSLSQLCHSACRYQLTRTHCRSSVISRTSSNRTSLVQETRAMETAMAIPKPQAMEAATQRATATVTQRPRVTAVETPLVTTTDRPRTMAMVSCDPLDRKMALEVLTNTGNGANGNSASATGNGNGNAAGNGNKASADGNSADGNGANGNALGNANALGNGNGNGNAAGNGQSPTSLSSSLQLLLLSTS